MTITLKKIDFVLLFSNYKLFYDDIETMFASFKQTPSRDLLDAIVVDALNKLAKAQVRPQGKGLSLSMAESFSFGWLVSDSTPGFSNKLVIHHNFEQILKDIDDFQKYSVQDQQILKIYENLIKSYSKKLIEVNNL